MKVKKHSKEKIKQIVEDFEQKCQPTPDELENTETDAGGKIDKK